MKKKKSISELTLKTITKKQIKPIPKWEFIAKNWTLWAGILASLVVLIIGLGLVIFGVIDDIISPYFWVLVAIVFFILVFLLFEKTKRAYHFPKWQVVAGISIVGLIIGGVVFRSGLARKIDLDLETNIPRYRQMAPMKTAAWTNPSEGYLSGEIIKIDKNSFEIKDFEGKKWTITGTPSSRGRVFMVVGEEIKIIGTQVDENTFEGTDIRPWMGRGQNMMKENY
jgi:uncharacterized integral membrane protein